MAYLDAAGVTKLTQLYDERYGGGSGGGGATLYRIYGGSLSPDPSNGMGFDEMQDDISNYQRITVVYNANDRQYCQSFVNNGAQSFTTNIVKSHANPDTGNIYTSQAELTFWGNTIGIYYCSSYVVTKANAITGSNVTNTNFEVTDVYGEKMQVVDVGA